MIKKFIGCFALLMMMPQMVYAAATPQFVNGTVNLITDATKWLLLIIPIAGGLVIGIRALKGLFAEDEQDAKVPRKLVKSVFFWVVVAEIADAVILLVVSYYSA